MSRLIDLRAPYFIKLTSEDPDTKTLSSAALDVYIWRGDLTNRPTSPTYSFSNSVLGSQSFIIFELSEFARDEIRISFDGDDRVTEPVYIQWEAVKSYVEPNATQDVEHGLVFGLDGYLSHGEGMQHTNNLFRFSGSGVIGGDGTGTGIIDEEDTIRVTITSDITSSEVDILFLSGTGWMFSSAIVDATGASVTSGVTYQWQKRELNTEAWNDIAGSTRSTLTISDSDATLTAVGDYRLRVRYRSEDFFSNVIRAQLSTTLGVCLPNQLLNRNNPVEVGRSQGATGSLNIVCMAPVGSTPATTYREPTVADFELPSTLSGSSLPDADFVEPSLTFVDDGRRRTITITFTAREDIPTADPRFGVYIFRTYNVNGSPANPFTIWIRQLSQLGIFAVNVSPVSIPADTTANDFVPFTPPLEIARSLTLGGGLEAGQPASAEIRMVLRETGSLTEINTADLPAYLTTFPARVRIGTRNIVINGVRTTGALGVLFAEAETGEALVATDYNPGDSITRAVDNATGVVTVTVAGEVGATYDLRMLDVDPSGWTSIDNLNSSSGTVTDPPTEHRFVFDDNDTSGARRFRLAAHNTLDDRDIEVSERVVQETPSRSLTTDVRMIPSTGTWSSDRGTRSNDEQVSVTSNTHWVAVITGNFYFASHSIDPGVTSNGDLLYKEISGNINSNANDVRPFHVRRGENLDFDTATGDIRFYWADDASRSTPIRTIPISQEGNTPRMRFVSTDEARLLPIAGTITTTAIGDSVANAGDLDIDSNVPWTLQYNADEVFIGRSSGNFGYANIRCYFLGGTTTSTITLIDQSGNVGNQTLTLTLVTDIPVEVDIVGPSTALTGSTINSRVTGRSTASSVSIAVFRNTTSSSSGGTQIATGTATPVNGVFSFNFTDTRSTIATFYYYAEVTAGGTTTTSRIDAVSWLSSGVLAPGTLNLSRTRVSLVPGGRASVLAGLPTTVGVSWSLPDAPSRANLTAVGSVSPTNPSIRGVVITANPSATVGTYTVRGTRSDNMMFEDITVTVTNQRLILTSQSGVALPVDSLNRFVINTSAFVNTLVTNISFDGTDTGDQGWFVGATGLNWISFALVNDGAIGEYTDRLTGTGEQTIAIRIESNVYSVASAERSTTVPFERNDGPQRAIRITQAGYIPPEDTGDGENAGGGSLEDDPLRDDTRDEPTAPDNGDNGQGGGSGGSGGGVGREPGPVEGEEPSIGL